ncbi:MAG: spore protease YyaC [Alistipes sp.]|nr:spore protease YyaC [Alistipes sp.]
MITYYDSANQISSYKMGLDLSSLINAKMKRDNQLIILCIGSDRSTGDSLGPLIGHKLSRYNLDNVFIYGTLQEPVHASNIQHAIDAIYDNFDNPFIVAIDASLGTRNHVGYYTLGQGPLVPGLGVNRTLPAIGDIHITGIVNYSGLFDGMLLQTTRLSSVMTLADTISTGIIIGIRHCIHATIENYA